MTPNKEDYLKCIYEISIDLEKITNKEIAARMQVSPPAVTEMIKKLLAEGLIEKDKKKGYYLTEQGILVTSDLYRKHRLIEVFLVHHLGYTADEIHEEAEVLEHTVSDRFVERLDAMLHYPTACPHGGTIPKKGQTLVEAHTSTLSMMKERGLYKLVRVQDSFELLHYLEQQDLHLGDLVELLSHDSFSQLYLVKHEGRELQLPPNIASQLFVEKA